MKTALAICGCLLCVAIFLCSIALLVYIIHEIISASKR